MQLGSRIKLFFYDSKIFLKNFFRLLYHRLQVLYYFFKKTSYQLSPIRTSAHLILWLVFFALLSFIVWAKFAVLEEVTTAPATVIPMSHVLIVQNMEGGIIQKIIVHEGDIVEKEQILGYLDPTRFLSSLDEAKVRTQTLEIKIARLTAETSEQSFLIPPELENSTNPAVLGQLASEKALYHSHNEQIVQMKKNVALATQELTMTKPLVSKGAASVVEILHLERQILDLQNQIDQFHSRQLDELATAKADLATIKAATLALQDRLNRTTIRSSIRGVIKQIRIATPGSVIQPGAEIMSIVPLENKLFVEARVKPSDIGFIHAGETASVKITAYDFSIYGGLEGYVDKVSADTITDQKGNTYYIVRVKTTKNYLRTAENPLYIIPGMTATVSILTGKRTVLNYLLSPLLKVRETALRER